MLLSQAPDTSSLAFAPLCGCPSPLRLPLVFSGHSSVYGETHTRALLLVEEDSGMGNPCVFIQVKHGAGADTCFSCQKDLHGLKSKRKFTAEAHGAAGASRHSTSPMLHCTWT